VSHRGSLGCVKNGAIAVRSARVALDVETIGVGECGIHSPGLAAVSREDKERLDGEIADNTTDSPISVGTHSANVHQGGTDSSVGPVLLPRISAIVCAENVAASESAAVSLDSSTAAGLRKAIEPVEVTPAKLEVLGGPSSAGVLQRVRGRKTLRLGNVSIAIAACRSINSRWS
jgi:hypothetical protein